MPDIKVYTPTVIAEVPFPTDESSPGVESNSSFSSSGQRYEQREIPQESFPTSRIAVELLSTALNTRSKKILGEFQFTAMGAIQIGKYEAGVSGDIRISPAGIVARNREGVNTIAIDPETGDAYFSGRIQSGSVVTGQLVVGDGNVIIDGEGGGSITIKDENNTTFIDSKGLVSTANFSAASVSGSGTQTTTSTTFSDLTGIYLDITLARASKVYMFAHARGIYGNYWGAYYLQFKLLAGSTQVGKTMICPGIPNGFLSGDPQMIAMTVSTGEVLELPAGTTRLKLQFANYIGSDSSIAYKSDTIIGYLVMGK